MQRRQEVLHLKAGSFELKFEPKNLMVRGWKVNGVEVLRGVVLALRDSNWGTLQPAVRVGTSEVGRKQFLIKFTAHYQVKGKNIFYWECEFRGKPDGEVILSARGHALLEIKSNRAGFCVLHAPETAGRSCTIEHVNGKRESARFPREISPHQPFFDIRSVSHSPQAGISVEVRMEGETFEMEDQRNWTDGSFKTYCRPLRLPFPYTLKPGEVVEQRIVVRVKSAERSHKVARSHSKTILLKQSPGVVKIPDIGVSCPLRSLEDTATTKLRGAGLEHLRIDLDLSAQNVCEQGTKGLQIASQIGCGLDIAVFMEEDEMGRLEEFLKRNADLASLQARWLIFSRKERLTTRHLWRGARSVLLRNGYHPSKIGGGTNIYFVDLNRNRPIFDQMGFVGFSINPQVHAFDDLSILETLPMQTLTVRETTRLGKGTAVRVGPITFRPRFNPVATSADDITPLPDPRQEGPFGAVWTLGSIAALCEGGAAGATFYTAAGPGGLVSESGQETMPYHVFVALHAPGRKRVRLLKSSEALAGFGLTFFHDGGFRCLVGNAKNRAETFRLEGLPHGTCRLRMLTSNKKSSSSLKSCKGVLTLALPAYAVAQIDFKPI